MKSLLTGLALVLLLPITALAHSPLKSTSPADKAALKVLPDGITMTFGKPARITKVTLTHTHGEANHADKLELPSKKFQTSFQLTPTFRGHGNYKVDWRALSEDGHALKGAFSFTVAE